MKFQNSCICTISNLLLLVLTCSLPHQPPAAPFCPLQNIFELTIIMILIILCIYNYSHYPASTILPETVKTERRYAELFSIEFVTAFTRPWAQKAPHYVQRKSLSVISKVTSQYVLFFLLFCKVCRNNYCPTCLPREW